MGIYDREYFQEEGRPSGFHLGGSQPMMVTKLVVVTCGLFIVDLFMEGGLRELLRVHADMYRRPWEFWRLLSYGFAHGGFWHVALNMFMLWMFGRVVETRLGRREILLFYLAAIVVSGLVWLIATDLWLLGTAAGQADRAAEGFPAMIGASGGVTAVFLLFVLFYPRQTVYVWGLVAVPAWLIGALIIGQDLWLGLRGQSGSTAWQAHLGGAAFAFLYLRLGWNFSRYVPSSIRWKWPRSTPRLRIHRDDDDPDTLDAEADRVLEKLHREGERNLTARERRVLEQYSRRMRERRR
jgi:membrane associated rhomboid family serine protease